MTLLTVLQHCARKSTRLKPVLQKWKMACPCGRRRCNVRILGVPETLGSALTASVAKLLAEVLQLEKELLIDRSHSGPGSTKPGGKPRVIIAKLHYYQDCLEVLRQARSRVPLRFNGSTVSIFPDYTTSVAKARVTFTNVRRLLRDNQGVLYGLMFPA